MTDAEKQAKRDNVRRRFNMALDAKIAKQRAAQDTARAPRYDDVFFDGVEWLNSL